jgi:hypothetical protein
MTQFVFGQHRVKIISSHIKDLRMVECLYPSTDVIMYQVGRIMDQSYLTVVTRGLTNGFKIVALHSKICSIQRTSFFSHDEINNAVKENEEEPKILLRQKRKITYQSFSHLSCSISSRVKVQDE